MIKNKKWIILLIPAAIILTGLLIVFGILHHISNSRAYEAAVQLLANNQASDAYSLFMDLGDYADSRHQVQLILENYPSLRLRDAQPDSLVTFGNWEQDGNPDNGPEPVSWIVLEKDNNRLLLLSECVLDCRSYHDEFGTVTWEMSELRTWLNGEFKQAVFNNLEQALIMNTDLENADNRRLGTPGGLNTRDRLFLLSESDASIYFASEERRALNAPARASTWAVERGVQVDDAGVAMWWLRTPGADDYAVEYMDQQGEIYESGAYADISDMFGVRPAMWVALR